MDGSELSDPESGGKVPARRSVLRAMDRSAKAESSRREFLTGVGSVAATLLADDPESAPAVGPFREPTTPEQVEDPAFDGTDVTIGLEPVYGSCEEFWRVFEAGSVDEFGEGTIGFTELSLDINGTGMYEFEPSDDLWDVRTESDGTTYVASNFDLQFSGSYAISILDWRPEDRPSDQCLAAWRKMFQQTLDHERRHVEIWENRIQNANREWADKEIRVQASSRTGARRALERRIKAAIEQSVNDIYRKDGAHETLHEDQEPITSFCDQCDACTGVGRDIENVQSYRLETRYRFSGELPLDRGLWSVRQTALGQFRLERESPPGGPVATAARLIQGLARGLAGLTGSQDSPMPDNGPPLRWSGLGSVTGSYAATLDTGDGTLYNRQQVQSTYEISPNGSAPARVVGLRRDDAFDLDWPGTVSELADAPAGMIGLPAQFNTGMRAQSESQIDSFTQLATKRITHDAAQCGTTFSKRITNDLEGYGPYRLMLGSLASQISDQQEAEGSGTETLVMSLWPTSFGDDQDEPRSYVTIEP